MTVGEEALIQKLNQQISSLEKQLLYATEEIEDWKKRCKILEEELNESREYMDIDYDREY